MGQDSIQIKNYEIINYEKELKKFKDSISKIIYPVTLSKKYSKFDSNLIIDNTDNIDKLYKLSQSSFIKKKKDDSKIETNGSISRGVTIGSNTRKLPYAFVIISRLDAIICKPFFCGEVSV